MSIPDLNQYMYADFMKENANLSLRNDRNEMCLLAKAFRYQYQLVALVFLQFLMSALTLFVLYKIFKCKQIRRVYSITEKDLKIIFIFGFVLYISTTVNAFFTYLYKLALLLFNLEPCSYIWSGLSCYLSSFYFGSFGVAIYMWIHASLFLERCFVALAWRPKLFKDGTMGVLLCIMSAAFTLLPQYAVLKNYQMFMNERLYCGSLLTTINPTVTASTYFVCACDLVISCMDFLLYIYNKKQIRRKKQQILCPRNYRLEHSFNLKSMQISIEVIYPFSFVHSLTFCLQSIAYVFYVQYSDSVRLITGHILFELVNCNRIGANFILFTFLYLYNQLKRHGSAIVFVQTNEEGDIYFKQFEQMIG